MAVNINEFISPEALYKLPEPICNSITNTLLSRLKPSPSEQPQTWEIAHKNFSLLAQSPLGSICGVNAQSIINNLKWGDVRHLIDLPIGEPAWLPINKNGYPVYIAPPVHYALTIVITNAMSQNPTRNRGLRELKDHERIAPTSQSNAQLTQMQSNLLKEIGSKFGVSPSLSELRAASRWLLSRVYTLDVLHAVLGLVECTAPPEDQLKNGPNSLFKKMNGNGNENQ